MNLYERTFAFEKLQEHVKTKRLLKHSFAVEGAMIKYAEVLGEDPNRFGTCGLLHDIDFEEFPEQHPGIGLDWLRTYGYDEEFVIAVEGHGDNDVQRTTTLAKTLYAVDELSSFIIAVALVRPTKFEGLKIKSVKKKLKDKAFAAAVNRQDIYDGAEAMGIELTDHIQNVIDGLVEHNERLGELGYSLVE